ncbi:phage holin family protein [Domibacillus epiphyticus]|uniref:Phage holin family protein n=1 Tax=Domibacillus epiphyticus TaxID=1714355 RepID=A0A1V2ABU8_9BACI|nr:phage holin family protein [Domibacillus epiphyticus]OMP68274.1 hypothetical protein BTO28_03150 [Domibacillus epiphyticus]
MGWLIGVLINAVLFIALSGYFPGLHVDSFLSAIIASFVLSILNLLVRPFLIMLTLPITIVTLGLFLFVINAVTLLMTDGIMGYAFEIESFGLAVIIAIAMAVVNIVLQMTVLRKK